MKLTWENPLLSQFLHVNLGVSNTHEVREGISCYVTGLD